MSRVNFIFDTAQQNGGLSMLIESYDSTATVSPASAVRMDKQVAFSVQPVTVSISADGNTVYTPDFLDTDNYYLAIGNPDEPAISGTFDLDVDGVTTNLLNLAFDISAASLQTPLAAAFVTATGIGCTVVKLTTGIFEITGTANGLISTGLLTADVTDLFPACGYSVVEESLGVDNPNGAPFVILLVMRQSPLVLSHPTTLLDATDVAVSTIQAGSATASQIQSVDFAVDPTYAGTFSIAAAVPDTDNVKTIDQNTMANPTIVRTTTAHGYTTGDSVCLTGTNCTPNIDGTSVITVTDSTHFSVPVNVTIAGTAGSATKLQSAQCGIAKPTMTADEFGAVLTNHSLIFYKDTTEADNISVTKSGSSFIVSFIGTLGSLALPGGQPALTATNVDLVAPRGFSGVINYNTVALFKYSLTQGDVFNLPLTIQRRRVDGEIRTVFGPVDDTIYKDNLDPMTMTPTTIPSFLDMLNEAIATVPTSYVSGEVWLNGSVLSYGTP